MRKNINDNMMKIYYCWHKICLTNICLLKNAMKVEYGGSHAKRGLVTQIR